MPEPQRLLLHMPVDIRNMSLVVLAGLAFLFVLHWAKAVFIPVMVGVLFSYALSPVVNWLETGACRAGWRGRAAAGHPGRSRAPPPGRSATRPRS
jgi:predicted PurR-regulated permease PerM